MGPSNGQDRRMASPSACFEWSGFKCGHCNEAVAQPQENATLVPSPRQVVTSQQQDIPVESAYKKPVIMCFEHGLMTPKRCPMLSHWNFSGKSEIHAPAEMFKVYFISHNVALPHSSFSTSSGS